MSTTQLQALLREECEGRGSMSVDSILDLCQVLSKRNANWPTYKESVLQICRNYLEG